MDRPKMDFLPRIVAETSSMASWTSPLLMTSELTSARRPLYLNKEESYLDKGRVVKFKATHGRLIKSICRLQTK